jgi:DNA sulfur modification protein DndC
VETPYIIDFMKSTLHLMEEAARSLGLPVQTKLVRPELNDTYWVRVIGYGYPPPSKFMRWCTDRLKIKPADRFIVERVSEHGEVMLLLGMRESESQHRAESLRRHEAENGLHKHSSLPNAWVWAPIRYFSLEEVWTYLIFNPSPWGGDNRALRDLYKNANSGECPLVVDETTEPCGNSRFGCYTCTVVDKDKSLEGFVLAGQDRYKDLVDLRNWLVALRDDHANRLSVRRNGQPGVGPLKMAVREAILERLLGLQDELGEELIAPAEVSVIKQVWLSETLQTEASSAAA